MCACVLANADASSVVLKAVQAFYASGEMPRDGTQTYVALICDGEGPAGTWEAYVKGLHDV